MDQQHNLADKVMGDIASGRVRLRSRYIFLAEKFGLSSAVILTVLLAALFMCLALFYFQVTDNLVYLSFGKSGLFAFLESFPYLLVIFLIGLIFVAGALIRQSGVAYKRPFGYVALGLLVFVLLAGVALARTTIAEKIEGRLHERGPGNLLFGPMFHNAMGERRRGITGRIADVTKTYVVLQTPRGARNVDVSRVRFLVIGEEATGKFLVAVGVWDGAVFHAFQARVVEENDFPVLRRDVRRRFGAFVPHYPKGDFCQPTSTGCGQEMK